MPSSYAASLTSQVSYKKVVEMDGASYGDHVVSLDDIPKNQWKKYDGNGNWKMTTEGEVIIQRPGIEPVTYIRCVFRLLGKEGRVLKTEAHFCPYKKYSPQQIQMANDRLAAAQALVDAGRGDEIADEAFWEKYPNGSRG
jgi:hypothetical protein